MPLSAGEKLGPFEILAPIGAGGMGEVWKARDTRLDRIVAIKTSKTEFSERFEREARAVAALNHPNICQLYDVGPNYLVMEFIEGTPLKGPIMLEKAVAYGGQILDALDAAHKKGFTHRDLKPANILLTKHGIKLLDFGLAKHRPAIGESDATRTIAMTQEGSIAGTLQYMAPEQLQGKETDPRSDLFAFGCVFYELLSGKQAFNGASAASVIAAILEREPPSLEVSSPLERLIRTCLAKDPDQRFQSAVDLKRALQWAVEQTTPPASVSRRSISGIAALALVALSMATAAGYLIWTRAPKPELTRLDFEAPAGMPLVQGGLAISPDGRTLAFAAGAPEKPMIWLRPLGAATAHALPGTEGGSAPFWSPDASYVGFIVPGSDERSQVKKVAAAGGAPQVLAEVPHGLWATWGRDGTILVSQVGQGQLYRVSASGGQANEATVLDNSRGEFSHRWPQFLPDGRHFLFLILSRDPANSGIFVGALDSNERTRLNDARSNAAYASGHLLYVRERVLLAQPFDARTRRLSGEAVPVFENIEYANNTLIGAFSASESNLVARALKLAPLRQLTWLDRSGARLKTAGDPGDLYAQRLSPDGHRLAVSKGDRQGGLRELWILDLERGVFSPLSKGLFGPSTLVFSPDGSRIAFSRGLRSYIVPVGGGVETQLANDANPTDWSLDGQYMALAAMTGPPTTIMPLKDGARPFQSPEQGASGRFSPDEKWIAYVVGPPMEVYVEPFSGAPSKGAGKIQVSPAGGREPRWSRDGKELFYISGDNRLMATPVRLGPPFSVGIPKALFEIPAGVTYDVAADGKRFLLNLEIGEASPDPPLTVLLNWPSAMPH